MASRTQVLQAILSIRIYIWALLLSISFFSAKAQDPSFYRGADGRFVFGKPFNSIKDIPQFSAYDSLPDGKWVQLYPGGATALEFTIKNHTMNGPAKGYFSSGKIRFEFAFYENFIHGEFKEYYESGLVHRKFNYNEGLMNGEWFVYYPTGELHGKGTNVNDSQEGKMYYYWPNGNLKEERTYIKNKISGTMIYWYENGNKQSEGTNDGLNSKVGNWSFWYEDGSLHKKCTYEKGIERVWEAWNRKGIQMIKEGNGRYVLTDAFGNKKIEGTYIDGWMHGLWYTYENGTIREQYYDRGLKK